MTSFMDETFAKTKIGFHCPPSFIPIPVVVTFRWMIEENTAIGRWRHQQSTSCWWQGGNPLMRLSTNARWKNIVIDITGTNDWNGLIVCCPCCSSNYFCASEACLSFLPWLFSFAPGDSEWETSLLQGGDEGLKHLWSMDSRVGAEGVELFAFKKEKLQTTRHRLLFPENDSLASDSSFKVFSVMLSTWIIFESWHWVILLSSSSFFGKQVRQDWPNLHLFC